MRYPNSPHDGEAKVILDDGAAWRNAASRDTRSALEEYVRLWPNGRHASEAQEKMADEKAWEEACVVNTKD